MPRGIFKRKPFTEEHKRKLSKVLKGRKLSKEHIKNRTESRAGYRHSEETKRKMSKSASGENNSHWGKFHSEETKRKISESGKGKHTNEKNGNWKGDNVSCRVLHTWVYNHKGRPKVCIHCGATYKERKLVWANKDHSYKRNLDDFISLCYSCHLKYDYKYNNRKSNKKR